MAQIINPKTGGYVGDPHPDWGIRLVPGDGPSGQVFSTPASRTPQIPLEEAHAILAALNDPYRIVCPHGKWWHF